MATTSIDLHDLWIPIDGSLDGRGASEFIRLDNLGRVAETRICWSYATDDPDALPMNLPPSAFVVLQQKAKSMFLHLKLALTAGVQYIPRFIRGAILAASEERAVAVAGTQALLFPGLGAQGGLPLTAEADARLDVPPAVASVLQDSSQDNAALGLGASGASDITGSFSGSDSLPDSDSPGSIGSPEPVEGADGLEGARLLAVAHEFHRNYARRGSDSSSSDGSCATRRCGLQFDAQESVTVMAASFVDFVPDDPKGL